MPGGEIHKRHRWDESSFCGANGTAAMLAAAITQVARNWLPADGLQRSALALGFTEPQIV